jgi:hypothetical protein
MLTGIGDLIIDLDADIEKSSSSNLDSSLVIPLQSGANISGSERISVDKAPDNERSDTSESDKSLINSHSKGETHIKRLRSTTNCFRIQVKTNPPWHPRQIPETKEHRRCPSIIR